jgi:hypothetical protein
MNQKVLAGLAAVGLLAGGGSATALAAVSAPAAASTAVVASSTSMAPGHGPLSSLVAKGTITQAQATDIRNAFITYTQGHWRSTVDTVLGQLVHSHTITKAQAGAVTTAITQWVQTHRGDAPGHRGPRHHRGWM